MCDVEFSPPFLSLRSLALKCKIHYNNWQQLPDIEIGGFGMDVAHPTDKTSKTVRDMEAEEKPL